MAIISFDTDAVVEYVPEFNDNREDKKPCTVGLKFVNFGKAKAYGNQLNKMVAAKTKGQRIEKIQEIQSKVESEIQKQQFMDNVVSIKGFSVIDKDGKVKECTDVGTFFEKADVGLIVEIIQAMESSAKLTEGQRKN